jgi:uncharacterized protein YukE
MTATQLPTLVHSADPDELIPGNPAELRASAQNYTTLGNQLEQAGSSMRGQVIFNWKGDAAHGYDTYREQGSQRYFTAADIAHQSAALLNTRAQSIEDNRRQADAALALRANTTREAQARDIPTDGPEWDVGFPS